MFNKEERKEFLIKYGKRWLFPDFTNKLTWLVVLVGASLFLTPTLVKLAICNYLVKVFELNSGVPFNMEDFKLTTIDYVVGAFLIGIALLHNVANKYFIYITSKLESHHSTSTAEVDKLLFKQFIIEFPSNSKSIRFLSEHDFGGSYHENNTDQIEGFVNSWNNAEKQFLDPELESKREELWRNCHSLICKLSNKCFYLNSGPLLTCIPDSCRSEFNWPEEVNLMVKELNELATECFNSHQSLVSACRRKLKC